MQEAKCRSTRKLLRSQTDLLQLRTFLPSSRLSLLLLSRFPPHLSSSSCPPPAAERSEYPFLLYSHHERLCCHIPSVPPHSSWLSLFSLSISRAHPPFFTPIIHFHSALFLSPVTLLVLSLPYLLTHLLAFFVPFISTFSCDILSPVSPFSLLLLPYSRLHLIILLPPRHHILITRCHLYPWTGKEESGRMSLDEDQKSKHF